MLERLNEVDWTRLTHAFGEASDVPGYIRALSSNDREERDEAIGSLFGTIWHQGTVYGATAVAVPFLVELLEVRHVAGKDEILHLLAGIAEGHSYIDVHGAAFQRMGMEPGSEQERADFEARLQRELGWVRAASEAVEAGVPTYRKLRFDDDPAVRIFAAYTLAHCLGRSEEIIPELIAWIRAEEQARVRAALILALASLETAKVGRGAGHALIDVQIGPTEQPVVRLAAAILMARSSSGEPTAGILAVLTESTASAWSDFEQLPWCEGAVAVTVGESLADHPSRVWIS